ncbi:class I SAM-dependent methyltransferase [Azorhizobium oxalatiphilum]|uniref:class I SAM-dependent methyltransferase n=1 Tax=Azorhizobium oxalatiphilum TaxID=980631 RepID=UPI001FCEF378|nr:class I SAM-dependent methyltransferase [Azorhizobium oxalatiphilum]
MEENIDTTRISGFSFASRKEPEYMCHRLMRCSRCDLVYVSNPPGQDELARAYHVSDYDSSEEATDAAVSYIAAMRPILAKLAQKERVLEIGSGTGILLEFLQSEGFSTLVGVEPSSAAIAAAPAHRRDWLREGIFIESDFEPASFDLICCFMTMEHVQDPKATAMAARRLLRPGGAFVTVTHDYTSLVNRLLGKKSPIIDIEHMQIFSGPSLRELFSRCGYQDIGLKPFYNRYSLKYWLRLAPLPSPLKTFVRAACGRTGLDRMKLAVNVGNTMAAGFVPR